MTVVNLWVGAVTHNSARVIAKASSGATSVELLVSVNPDVSSPTVFGPETPDAQDIVAFEATGLSPGTRYYYALDEDNTFDSLVDPIGTFHTHAAAPGNPFSFTFAAGGCAGSNPAFPGDGTELDSDRVSNHPVFTEIRDLAVANNWLFFLHTGDFHYLNLGVDYPSTLTNYRRSYDDVLHQSNQQALYKDVPLVYGWDDHDYDGNNSDGTFVDKLNAQQVYRERVPSYPLIIDGTDPNDNPIYHSFQIGRVLFAITDMRSSRSPNSDPDDSSKTMLGANQKTWFRNLLTDSDAALLVWMSSLPWITPESGGGGPDGWTGFTAEAAELVDLFIDTGFIDRMMVISGDAHHLSMDDGTNTPGRVPLFISNHLDSSPGTSNVAWSEGDAINNKGQYGTIEITDDGGDVINVTWQGWAQGENLLRTFSFTAPESFTTPVPPAVFPDVTNLIKGSHDVVFDVRVLETFQTGDAPTGTTVDLHDGEVTIDGTRDIRSTAKIRVPGSFGQDGRSAFPRGRSNLLAPFGNEVFIRYGIDIGTEVLWTPLGYFRFTTTDQDDAPHNPISLRCEDRMATLIDSELIFPRVYNPPAVVGDVFDDLILDVYLDAVIEFDDLTNMIPLNRQVIAEKNRYEPLKELAESFGKIFFWNDVGVARIESPPDPDVITWEVRSKRGGVLVNAARRLTRKEIANAVVVEGEGGDTDDPVRAIAFDNDVNSPTMFGGRFGKVPTFLTTPLVTTQSQAENAAVVLLRRQAIGAPFELDFDAITNPALRPFDVVRVTYSNGDRDVHVVDSVTIPLDEDKDMSAETRERVVILVGRA